MNLKHEQNANMQPNVVLLIDAENIHSKFAKEIIAYIERLGNVVLKRIYGDWQCTSIKSWRAPALFYNITPCQQFSITNSQNKTKNSTDIALIIDAMTFLYEKEIDIFCIVSSDCDFYTLVRTLREKNKTVIGFGGLQVNENYKNSFDTFITLQECKESKQRRKMQQMQTSILASSTQKQQSNVQACKTSATKQIKNTTTTKQTSNIKKVSTTRQKNASQQPLDSFLKQNTPLATKIKVYLLSILDHNTKNGQVCDGKILFDKLVEHSTYKAGIAVDSYKHFVKYLQNVLKNSKYTLFVKNQKLSIIKK